MKRSRTPLIIAVVLVVVAAAAIIAVVATRGDGDDDAESASTVPPPAATGGTATGGTASDGTAAPGAAGVSAEGQPLPPFEDPSADAAVGMPAPALRGADYSRAEVAVTPGAGGPKMVVFLAHWCPHCNNEIPVLLEWRDSGQIPADLEIVGVSTAADPSAPNYPPDEWLADRGWTWPVIADDAELTAANAYGVTGFPSFTIIDADGNVALRASGEIPLDQLNDLVSSVVS